MNYKQACQFVGEAAKAGSILGLDNSRRLMRELHDVQERLCVVHIGGTNGKGSVGAYLASILKSAGMTVGRYCSPAVFDALEILQFDGEMISKEEYAAVVSQVKEACDRLTAEGSPMPTAFEIETAAAFLWFAQKAPDVVLLEVGMGGATDATNIISTPLCSVITAISRDHMQFLGETIAEIAAVKAGIIKSGCPVFSAYQEPEAARVLKEYAKEMGSDIRFLEESAGLPVHYTEESMEFSYWLAQEETNLEIRTQMVGTYQVQNACLAIETAYDILKKRDVADVRACIEEGIRLAKWKGRFEILGSRPLFILDGAHNEGAARELAGTLSAYYGDKKFAYIIGMFRDKEHERILEIMLPHAKKVFTLTPDHARALHGECLAKEVKELFSRQMERERDNSRNIVVSSAMPQLMTKEEIDRNVRWCKNAQQAVELALESGLPVLVFGSLSFLGEIREAYGFLVEER